jgi:putative hydrolase of the HAD superfamily
LIYELNPDGGRAVRAATLAHIARGLGAEVTVKRAAEALRAAWLRHWKLWSQGIGSGSPEMARWALEELGLVDADAEQRLTQAFAEASLTEDIRRLDGARETLEALAQRGIRRALVCDTGFSPGRIVRRILDREGLLDLLEVTIFSDEVGVPKPSARMFELALAGCEVEPGGAVHVGDLRRTDVAGARAVGMGTVRIRWHHDDSSEHPDADAVAESHSHLQEILGLT